MSLLRTSMLVPICLSLLAVGVDAQPLAKRHKIGLEIGMWSQAADVRTEIGPGSVNTSVGSNGFMGGVNYCYWLQENLALDLRAAAMATDVDVQVSLLSVVSGSSSVTQIMLGLKYYLPRSTYGTSVRPYFAGSLGAFMGRQSETAVGLDVMVSSRTANAMGGRIGAGVDLVLGLHVLLDLQGGYNLMSDFDEPIGGSVNYGGPEFSLGIGYLFGGGDN